MKQLIIAISSDFGTELINVIMRIIYLHQFFNTPAMSGGVRSYDIANSLVKNVKR